ncbi:hypothetical protein QTO30_19790 [Yoonia sp. GPGPB17]|uniref:hypothetical protein n=1 Tax=Yoonia sp. GPGPB17 TaxID=3026147 RepID=UPI0030C29597
MDNPHSFANRANYGDVLRSLVTRGLLTAAVCLGQTVAAVAQSSQTEADQRIATHYRLLSNIRPRLGYFLTGPEAVMTGQNFEFCDGTRVSMELSEVRAVEDTCDSRNNGTFTLAAITESARKSIFFNEDGSSFGQLESISRNEDGTYRIRGFVDPNLLGFQEGTEQNLIGPSMVPVTTSYEELFFTPNPEGSIDTLFEEEAIRQIKDAIK